ncbi:hypothetical protein ANN_25027 [Periplaneta americana]|uniref:Uncharacterized protein n=1 Tax=Periplaneta americana TaxID=6978 RepID=A0ABQ8S0K0_PERAM|nr:hypothetical protein ANN_25027 [Periplaneta americana]
MKDLVLEDGMGCTKGCEECEYLENARNKIAQTDLGMDSARKRKEGKTKENLDGRYKKWNEGERLGRTGLGGKRRMEEKDKKLNTLETGRCVKVHTIPAGLGHGERDVLDRRLEDRTSTTLHDKLRGAHAGTADEGNPDMERVLHDGCDDRLRMDMRGFRAETYSHQIRHTWFSP